MQKIWNLRWTLLCSFACAAVFFCVLGQDRAQARPQYLRQFALQYKHLLEQAKEAKCKICHPKKKKKYHNKYGEAIEDVLGEEENVKDEDVIKKALKKSEEKDSAVDGKTYGDLIEAGELPNKGDKSGEDE